MKKLLFLLFLIGSALYGQTPITTNTLILPKQSARPTAPTTGAKLYDFFHAVEMRDSIGFTRIITARDTLYFLHASDVTGTYDIRTATAWITATPYAVNAVVDYIDASFITHYYICKTAHNSTGTYPTQNDGVKWKELFYFPGRTKFLQDSASAGTVGWYLRDTVGATQKAIHAYLIANNYTKTEANTLLGAKLDTTNATLAMRNSWTGAASHKTTEDALNGLVKVNGAGSYSAVTDGSSNWNTAYGWGNHTGLYGLVADSSKFVRLGGRTGGQTIAQGITFTGQVTSSLATGTSPFAVTSTTVNTNFNADLLDGQHGSYYASALSGTINEIAYFSSASAIGSLAVATYPSLTELAYIKGLSSAIQTQLNGKAATLSGTTNYVSKFTGASTIGNSVIYDNGTNVGIGTTGPGQRLHIYDTGAVTLAQFGGSGGTAGYIGGVNTAANGFTTSSALDMLVRGEGSNILFGFSTAEKMRITGAGNVGIGATNPGYKLEVNGTTYFNGASVINGTITITGGSPSVGKFLQSTDLNGLAIWAIPILTSLKDNTTTGLFQVTGLGAGTTRVKTVRDANDQLLELGGSYTPTASWNWTSASVTWPTFNQNTSGTAAGLSTILSSTWGGTGINNADRTLTISSYSGTLNFLAAGKTASFADSFTTSGSFPLTITTTASTSVTLPTTGTLATTTQALQWDGGATNLVAATGRTSLGLGTAALNVTGDFATAAQGTLATNAMPKSGGTFTDNVAIYANKYFSFGGATYSKIFWDGTYFNYWSAGYHNFSNIDGTANQFNTSSTGVNIPTGKTYQINNVALAKGDIGLGSVENTALSTWAGSANITILGTITTGAWNSSTKIALAYGGTNANLTASNGGIVFSNAGAMAILAGTITAGKALLSGSTTTPSWSASALGTAAFNATGDFATAAHTHSGVYEPVITILGSTRGGSGINNAGTLTWGAGGTLGTAAYTATSAYQAALNGTGFVKISGTTISYDNSSYSLTSHTHSGVYEPVISAGTTGQYWRGDKSWQNLNSTVVGLGNVTNESKTTMFTSPTFTTGIILDGVAGANSEFLIKKAGAIGAGNVGYYFSHRSDNTDFIFYGYDGTNFKNILNVDWNGVTTYRANTYHYFQDYSGTDQVNTNANGLNIPTGKAYQVNNTSGVTNTYANPSSITVAGGIVTAVTAGSGGITTTSVSLTASQLTYLYTTPIAILSAPGAGLMYDIISVELKNSITSSTFTGQSLYITSNNGTSALSYNTLFASNEALYTFGSGGYHGKMLGGTSGYMVRMYDNGTIYALRSGTGAQTCSTGSITLYITYRIITL